MVEKNNTRTMKGLDNAKKKFTIDVIKANDIFPTVSLTTNEKTPLSKCVYE